MADGVEFSLIGLDAINGKLEEVSHDVRYRGGRFALRRAAQVVRDAAKRGAQKIDDPATAENIAENIVERFSPRRFKSTGDIMFRVGVMGGAGGNKTSQDLAGLPGLDTTHWRYVELGTERAAAQPFLRPALSNNIDTATDTFIREYDKALDRALQRARKKLS